MRSKRAISLIAVVTVALGTVLIGWALVHQQRTSDPPAAVGTVDPDRTSPTPVDPPPSSTDGARGGADSGQEASGEAPLPLSPPRRLEIPAIDVDTAVHPIGKNPDGTLAVPQPGPRLDEAAWFEESPSPGQLGPSIIEGHVDTEQGPSVFADLATLRPGDEITVTRRDGVVATFTVDALRDVEKASFPTELVYGGKDLGSSTLRLITCSMFDPDIGTHVGNTVVFASLSDVTRS
ncbi:class F sortase [Nocardioides panacisoli]|uniref:class F sortase n=1 Tax=Nocardioides panacisoli TaxID=627624 RepID=UPI001F30ADC7|nr:class F sortase [Nocardioides panacisoli]